MSTSTFPRSVKAIRVSARQSNAAREDQELDCEPELVEGDSPAQAAGQGFTKDGRRPSRWDALDIQVMPSVVRGRTEVTQLVEPECWNDDLDTRIEWIGTDDRGVELEIIAVELPDLWLVIHVMPTALRRKP